GRPLDLEREARAGASGGRERERERLRVRTRDEGLLEAGLAVEPDARAHGFRARRAAVREAKRELALGRQIGDELLTPAAPHRDAGPAEASQAQLPLALDHASVLEPGGEVHGRRSLLARPAQDEARALGAI